MTETEIDFWLEPHRVALLFACNTRDYGATEAEIMAIIGQQYNRVDDDNFYEVYDHVNKALKQKQRQQRR